MSRDSAEALADRLAQCSWPPLASRYDAALRDAVEFIFAHVDAAGIVATGTIIRGQAHASSDLDIHVIGTAPYRQRIQRFFRGVPGEIFINPPQKIRDYFQQEHADGEPLTAHMLATGVVLWANDPVVDELRSEAGEWLARPNKPTEMQVIHARYAAATRFEDALDVAATDEPSATMLLTMAIIAMLEQHCRARDGRVPRRKELLGVVANSDSVLGELARAFFSSTSYRERQAAAEQIADRSISTRGFFEWDSGREPLTD